jgi:hypothetical protein
MGIARSERELQRAAEIASTTSGVRRVVSFMQVREPHNPTLAMGTLPAPTYRAPAPEPASAPATISYGAPAETQDVPAGAEFGGPADITPSAAAPY